MANRWFQQFRFSLEKYVVDLYAHVTFGEDGAPTLDIPKSKGIRSITRTGPGAYDVLLQDFYYRFLMTDKVFFGQNPAAPDMYVPAEDVVNRLAPTISLQFLNSGSGGGPGPDQVPSAAPSYGTSLDTFAVLAASTVTNTGNSVINGDLGLSPGTSVIGFPPGIVNGVQHITDATAAQAQVDLTAAYTDLQSRTSNVDLTGQDLGGMTLTPGVYTFSTSAQLTGVLTLDAQNNPDAVFIFQIGSTLTTASSSSVVMINGTSQNVYWQVGSSATIGTSTAFMGDILAQASITYTTGATNPYGRALARTGAVTLDTNTISVASQEVPGPDLPFNPPAPTDPADGDEVYLQFSLSNSGAI